MGFAFPFGAACGSAGVEHNRKIAKMDFRFRMSDFRRFAVALSCGAGRKISTHCERVASQRTRPASDIEIQSYATFARPGIPARRSLPRHSPLLRPAKMLAWSGPPRAAGEAFDELTSEEKYEPISKQLNLFNLWPDTSEVLYWHT